MDSHEIIKKTISKAGVKSVAMDMNLSPSLIYKWCEAKGDDCSGADNPLDRLLNLCQVTGEHAPIVWLCEQMNAFYVENISPEKAEEKMEVLNMTQRILGEFSGLLDMVARSMSSDNGIDKMEALKIREEWEDLKRVSEQFVLGCEMGVFAPGKEKILAEKV